MSASKKGPIVDPGMCRCCGLLKKCRLLNFEYEWQGRREVYSELFVDCFGLVLSHLDGEESERLICATCVTRLRDARAFRQQVLQCEEKLLNATVTIHEVGEDSSIKLEVQVKHEPVTEEPPQIIDEVDSDVEQHSEDMEVEAQAEGDAEAEPASTSRRKRKRAPPDGATVSDDSIHTDLLNRLQKIKNKLDSKILEDSTQDTRQRRPPILDKELNTIRNARTIIENSYVTPFIAVFSDYHCVYCREMILDPNKLREHTLEHDPRTYKEFETSKKMALVDITRIDCRLCQTHIDSIDSFKEHLTKIHNKHIFKDVDSEFIKFKLKTGKLNCLECNKSFNFFQALKKHMAEHFGTFICDVCGAHYFEERHLIFHKNSHNTERNVEMFPCTECDKTFRSKYSRNFHISRIHKNEAAYPCNKCDEVFLTYHMRYRHKMNFHGEKRQFPCEGCDKVYNCRKTLREHYQRTHLQLLRHECSLCDKKFYLPSALRDHMTSHTGERHYRCDYCGKTYPRKKALKVHLLSHSTEKKYKCNLCPSSYTQMNNFKNHMKSKHPLNEFNEAFS
ncbi:uncharacterized protein LOC142985108 [Anticarsia gemmatalis]|uniref:uncharacterized protein LOC142985108 n=1 Tax=Anticarsia gemmatalis TaxID=129554 RepID=UPI003F76639F